MRSAQAADPGEAADSRVPWWLWPNVLSLDAPVVAVTWLWLFAAGENLSFGWRIHAVVFGVVWCVYMADRLIDVWRVGAGAVPGAGGPIVPETSRHAFCRRHRVLMGGLLVVVGAVTLRGVLRVVPEVIAWNGLLASILVWIHFGQNLARTGPIFRVLFVAVLGGLLAFGVFQLGVSPVIKFGYLALCVGMAAYAARSDLAGEVAVLPKELLCGAAFALAVSLPVYSYSAGGWREIVVSANPWLFAALCSLNCLAISIREKDIDRHTDRLAFPQRFPWIEGAWPGLAAGLVAVCAVGLWRGRWQPTWHVPLAVAISGVALLALFAARRRLSVDAFRVLADAALLSPLLMIPLFRG